ncbi:MAG TPA: DoxX family protein [Bryobacteraceae bacterium]|nr:DoxX family protein [Bryobacteraceae bacterium]
MDEGIAQAQAQAGPLSLPAWKNVLSVTSAVVVALLFLVAGVWKITEPYDAASRMVNAKVPAALGLPAAVGFGIAETFGGILLLIPRFRRWGAWITGAMLVAFMVYVGYYYDVLRGADCSCFPWLKRAVGPGFFISDAAMLLLAGIAGYWARPSEGKRNAAIILGAVSVFGFVFFGVTYARQTGVEAPSQITVDGRPYSLQHGKHFVYFFDPECSHCYMAAKTMSEFEWLETKVVGVPTAQPQFAQSFLKDTGLNASISNDLDLLKKTFPFGDAPYGVAIENGRQKQFFAHFEGDDPASGLRKLGFIR